MGLRESLGSNKGMAAFAAIVLLVAAVALERQTTSSATGSEMFFTVDDGKTYFKAPAASVPPFDHDGKSAVRAYVYQCRGEKFVGYLERYKDDARGLIVSSPAGQAASASPQQQAAMQQAEMNGREVKRPGDKQWVNLLSPAGAKVTAVKAPPGKSGEVEAIEP